MKRILPIFTGLTPSLLRDTPTVGTAPWLPRNNMVLTPGGRYSLFLGCRSLGLPKGDAVLVPTFICRSVTYALSAAGCVPVYVNVDDGARLDLDHAESVYYDGVKAILMNHYLGFATGLEEAVAFAQNKQIHLIEDCTHALFSTHRGRDVGTFGDISVFSMWKTLSVTHVGALLGRDDIALSQGQEAPLTTDYLRFVENWELYQRAVAAQAEDRTTDIGLTPYKNFRTLGAFYPGYERFPRPGNLS